MNIKFYHDKSVGGISGWSWIDSDVGAWALPKADWEGSHLDNIKKYVTNYRTVIQAGGNQGMYPRLLSRMFSNVYTFEPDPLNFQALTLNCDQDNVVKFQAAVGESLNYCKINRLTMSNVGMHKVHEFQNALIPIVRVDDLIDRRDVDLIMLDIEGYEIKALKGMLFTIKMNRPVMFIENPSAEVLSWMDIVADYKVVDQSAMDTIFVAK